MINGTKRNIGNSRWKDRGGSKIDIGRHYGEGQKEVSDPVICEVFGCGHHLSPQEQLFSKRCPKHNIKETTLSIIDKHLSL